MLVIAQEMSIETTNFWEKCQRKRIKKTIITQTRKSLVSSRWNLNIHIVITLEFERNFTLFD